MQVLLQPENKIKEIPRVATVLGLLNKLGLKPTQALVIREGRLLTPDVQIFPDDQLKVRVVASRG
ncbi:hypothetical protein [Desulfonatronovibrio hydrogenovorans]|uniref:hypothetical protein n=1 Tax=Desulfonatronovibrio hydrogenovorans TaxID=53245 RepID=UPI000490E2D8|nr:hypothetical protein [Desulfonatronovibrio hydrogenovorans]